MSKICKICHAPTTSIENVCFGDVCERCWELNVLEWCNEAKRKSK